MLIKKKAEEAKVIFNHFATVKFGGRQNSSFFVTILREDGFELGDWVEDILMQDIFRLADKETEVDLVAPSLRELGFEEYSSTYEIYPRAKGLGLDLCPAEIIPRLCLGYPIYSPHKRVIVVTKDLRTSDRYSYLLSIKCDGKDRELNGIHNHPGRVFGPEVRLVFQDTRSNHKA